MRHLMIHDERADGGYPFDSDLHNMTDDGCPLIPDPTRWTDPDWRDTLGEMDTFEAPPIEPESGPSIQPIAAPLSRVLHCRFCGNTQAHSPASLLKYARCGYPECCGRAMEYFALQTPAEAVPVHLTAA
jgi:hypothetical protein